MRMFLNLNYRFFVIDNRFDNRIIGQDCAIKYDVVIESRGEFTYETHVIGIEDARLKLIQLLLTQDKTSVVFGNIVMARSLMLNMGDGNIGNALSVSDNKGPFTPAEFAEIINYPAQLSREAWSSFISSYQKSLTEYIVMAQKFNKAFAAVHGVPLPQVPSLQCEDMVLAGIVPRNEASRCCAIQ